MRAVDHKSHDQISEKTNLLSKGMGKYVVIRGLDINSGL